MNLHDLSLQTPWALWGLLPIAWVALERWWWRRRRRQPAFRFPGVAMLGELPRTTAARLAALPFALRLLALGLVVVALARPQLVSSADRDENEGIDIVLALDTSCSMQAADFQPQDRMFVAKKSIQEFILKRKNDRVAMVVFAGEAATWVPLTLDYSLVAQMLEEVGVGMLTDGTAIGTAIATALNRLRKSDTTSKVVVLLTDGDNNAGSISPNAAAGLAKDLGVKVYTILIGKGGAVPFPAGKDLFGRAVFRKQVIPTNPQLLQEIAATTGGEAYTATDKSELDARLIQVLDSLQRSRIEAAAQLRPYAELFPEVVLAALILMALEMLIAATRLWRFPS
ncbi:MAG: VWA domain-containing protein [Deltaproteobacteria bacterium]|nr:VWA domain-containing protein [Deltaproteobacteria bacterium]